MADTERLGPTQDRATKTAAGVAPKHVKPEPLRRHSKHFFSGGEACLSLLGRNRRMGAIASAYRKQVTVVCTVVDPLASSARALFG